MDEHLAKITISHEQMAEIDANYPSPTQNAELVFKHLRTEHPELTNWELLCFAAMYIGLVGDEYPWLKMPAMAINRLLHILHYKYPEKTSGTVGYVDETVHKDRKVKRQRNGGGDSKAIRSDGKNDKRPKKRRKKPRNRHQSGNRVPDRRGQSGLSEGNLARQENARRTQQRIADSDRDEKTS